jgi:phage/conjugal plasmid C-4 type zinc finger TraR family protein
MIPLRALERDLRQRLLDIRVRLRQLDPRASADIAADVRRNDLCDSAQAIGALDAQTMSVERLFLAAQRITKTLQRIADGTYGRCEDCDERIPPARLKAVPTATLCVRCQTAAESRTASAVRPRHATWDHEEALHL